MKQTLAVLALSTGLGLTGLGYSTATQAIPLNAQLIAQAANSLTWHNCRTCEIK